jgi:DNA-binding phage protein
MTAPGALSDQDVAKVAASAGLDPRTVARALSLGGRTRSLVTRLAIAKALRAHGFKREAVRLEAIEGKQQKQRRAAAK